MRAMRSRNVATAFATALLIGWSVPARGAGQAVPTYDDVAPLLKENCTGCHRPGGLGPFSLTTYAEARARAGRIAEMVADRRMPPWQPARGYGASAFEGEPRLTGGDRRLRFPGPRLPVRDEAPPDGERKGDDRRDDQPVVPHIA